RRWVIANRITLGQFVAFFAYMTMLAWPMIAFGWVTNMLQRGLASWKRMLEILDTVPSITDIQPRSRQNSRRSFSSDNKMIAAVSASSAASPGDIRGEIEFRDLTFS